MAETTQTWWAALCAVACLNIIAWGVSWLRVHRGGDPVDTSHGTFRRWQIWLSAGYVAGCAWRSAWPVYDVPRLCMVDSWASSVLVGRSVATVAELCFAAQWSVLLAAAARANGHAVTAFAARAILPLIATAEVFSWLSVLTTANLGHVVEESLWGVCAVLLVAGLLAGADRWAARHLRAFVAACCLAGAAYAVYMFTVDVPMYWARWLADEAAGRRYLDVATGLADAAGRSVVSHRWEDWRTEVVWMTLYFSVAVWVSIALAHAPAWRGRADAEPRGSLRGRVGPPRHRSVV